MIRSGSLGPGMRMGAGIGRKMGKIFRPLESVQKNHMRGREYVYLYIVGVASRFQGQGFGGKLLRPLIENSDQAGLPIYLDTKTTDSRW